MGYSLSDIAAERALDAEDIYSLYTENSITVPIPEDVDKYDFAKSVVSQIQSIWGEPEVNFPYKDVEFHTAFDDSGYLCVWIDQIPD